MVRGAVMHNFMEPLKVESLKLKPLREGEIVVKVVGERRLPLRSLGRAGEAARTAAGRARPRRAPASSKRSARA